ncbi:4-hydroxythreonine-4-phosphate dehydrogenase PdxA [Sphingobium naphthae]|nr:4-hydroxythreonine-4-phosphate dehydrogenase PdxA [Sphingobium naphthae]
MQPPIIALAIGDPNGIGPEIAVKAVIQSGALDPRLVLIGDEHVVRHYAADIPVRTVSPDALPPRDSGAIDLVDAAALAPEAFAPGNCNAASGTATVCYVEAALQAARLGGFGAIVACPHNETAVNAAGIAFSGYPGLVARLSGVAEDAVFLMLIGAGLRIVHVTLHERLADALARIDSPLVEAATRTAHQALQGLGIARPRIGLFGINPHAGEDGLFGEDDNRVTFPAAEALLREGLDIAGPRGADLLLSEGECDAYVAMYHDQGHIPIKLMAGRRSSALAIGAGVPFASVGHGSAPDIAGRGIADPAPLLQTIQLITGASASGAPQHDL